MWFCPSCFWFFWGAWGSRSGRIRFLLLFYSRKCTLVQPPSPPRVRGLPSPPDSGRRAARASRRRGRRGGRTEPILLSIAKNAYCFYDVCGYPKMPVVCFCEEDKIGWVADGGVLDARAKRGLVITPGQRWTSKDGKTVVLWSTARAVAVSCPGTTK